MYTFRTFSLILSALLVLLIASCSQGSKELVPATDTVDFAAGTFDLSEAELSAIASGDKSTLTVEFGDPALGQPTLNVPPTPEQVARLQGSPLPETTRTASTYGHDKCKKHRKQNCSPCKKQKKCRKVTGVCNRSERFWKVADCCSLTADVQYAAEVSFDDEEGDLSGVEVVFSRDGVEVGRALTGQDGFAYYSDKAVSRGPHSVNVCVASTSTVGDCGCPPAKNECKPKSDGCKSKKGECKSKTDDCNDCKKNKNKKNYSCKAKKGNCKSKTDDCNDCKKSKNKNDGKDNAPCDGNAGKGNDSRSASTASNDKCEPTPPPPPCVPCVSKDTCEPCSTAAVDGFFCSSINYAVYTDCIEGAVTGTGYFPSCNPLRVGLRDHMNFRIAYDDGAVQGYLNYSAGQYAGAPKIVDGQVKWLLISGDESWFGGDNFLVRVLDGGASFRDDYFEIWMEDPATCTTYCCGGYLTGCYVNISYRYSQKCP